ncbi:MAG: TolC family protein, partial [Chlamydiales bacterium]
MYMPDPTCPPPPSARCPTTQTYSSHSPTVCPINPSPNQTLALYDLVDIALLNSPKTRASWYNAKIAATSVGQARGDFLPDVAFIGNWMREQFSTVDLGIPFTNNMKFLQYGFSSHYLLLDFGGRNGRLEMALAALEKANWTYNWDIQSVMIQTIRSYYDHINALAILEASKAAVEDFEVTLKAAHGMKESGLVPLSDELQARTSLLRAQIAYEKEKGDVHISQANLAQSMGLSPDQIFTVHPLPKKLNVPQLCQNMQQIMNIAKLHRDDLKAMRMEVVRSKASIKAKRS